MEEIKVNEYVRSINGIIGKVNSINEAGKGCRFYRENLDETYINIKDSNDDTHRYSEKDIVKHSPNIIDLIEVGDYVNGEIVIDIGERGLYLGYADDNEHYSRIFIDESEIKSIVTKEMFNQVKYEV